MKPYIVCSFYTKNTPYEEEVKILRASCAKFNIKTDIRGYDSRGSWVRNCAIKSEFIYEVLVSNPGINVVFIDSDGEIMAYPELFDTLDCDIAGHYKDGWELMSNTLYFKNTASVRQFVRYWIDMQAAKPTEWDQKIMDKCLKEYKEPLNLKFVDLPPVYAQIFDTMAKNGQPIIEQHQASRRFKTKVTKNAPANIPDEAMKRGPRIADDGTFYIPRCPDSVAKLLEKDFCKFANENRWHIRSHGSIPIDDLKRYFQGKPCYIVGKGPSLDRLTPTDFPLKDSPIICINESIHKVESLPIENKLFILQQDTWLKSTCKPAKDTTIMVLNYSCQHWYADIRDKVCFHFAELGLRKRHLSCIYAIALAKLCGATAFKLLAFDASLNKDTGYARAIGYEPEQGGSRDRFLTHRLTILREANPVPLEFIPVGLAESSSCTQPLCKDNH